MTGLCLYANSQEADMRISEHINESEWFALADEYPKLKNSLEDNNLALMAEFVLASKFNKLEKTLDHIVTLVNEMQQQIVSNNAYSLACLGLDIYENMGQYDTAAKKAGGILESVRTENPDAVWQDIDNIYKRTSQLSDVSAPQIIRPNKEVIVKYTTYKSGKDGKSQEPIYINVKIKGKDYKFVFDTGTENTYISKHAAEKLGLKTLDAYNGFRMAHIDSIAIGDIIYKDPIAFVFDPLTQEKTLEQMDGVIGIDFIRRMGEICIDVRAKELIFPISNIKTKQNIHNIRLENGRKLFIESNDKSGNLKLLLSKERWKLISCSPTTRKILTNLQMRT